MTLDSLGRAAAETLTTQSAVGLEPSDALAKLVRTRRTRNRVKVGLSGLTAVAAVAVAFAVLPHSRPDAEPVIPTDPSPSPNRVAGAENGRIALVDQHGNILLEDEKAGFVNEVLIRADDMDGRVDNNSLAWTTDGQHLIYAVRRASGTEIIRFEPATGLSATLHTCDDVCATRVSPDQRHLAVATLAHLSVIDLENGERREIYGRQHADLDHPSWAPDGSAIVFEEKLNGTSRLLVADASGQTEAVALVEGDGDHVPSWPEWSPTGAEIAFLQPHAPFPNLFVTTIPAGGGASTPLFPAGEFPAGEGMTEAIERLFHERYQGVACSYGNAGTPASIAWSPDGTKLVVRSCAGTFWAPPNPDEAPHFIYSKVYNNPGDPQDFGIAAWQPVP